MLQIFNFLNCRKLNDEINIFSGVLNNNMFFIIVIVILILQILLVTFGSLAFGVYKYYGLTIKQWLISTGIGFSSIIINLLAKSIP
jgi:Ca2+ transporting ATPase